MKKEYLINIAMVLSIAVLFTSCDSRSTDYRMISVEAPSPWNLFVNIFTPSAIT